MVQINLVRKSTLLEANNESYRMTLEITSSEEITGKLFICQRIRNYIKQTFEDVIVAIATPVQLEDFEENSPGEGSSYFRTNKIDVISRNADYLEEVFEDITQQIKKLIGDVEALAVLTTESTYNISAEQINII